MSCREFWHTHFLGQRQQHTYWLFKLLDDVIVKATPHLERFVEIGTGAGALSVVLGLHAFRAGSHLLTFETMPKKFEPIRPVFDLLGVETAGDHWEEAERLLAHIDGRPTFFFCDGGNKAREFNTYAPQLPGGSIIAAHDFGVEIFPHDIAETVQALRLKPLIENQWRGKDDPQTCFYRVP